VTSQVFKTFVKKIVNKFTVAAAKIYDFCGFCPIKLMYKV